MKEDDFKKIPDELNREVASYSIPDEASCSAEFSSGCILHDEL